MAEYIEREAALRPFIIDKNGNRIHEVDIDNWQVEIPIKQVKQILREVPAADVVEVVRCGECIHRTNPKRISCKGRRNNWFCADGERRSE